MSELNEIYGFAQYSVDKRAPWWMKDYLVNWTENKIEGSGTALFREYVKVTF